MKNVPFHFRILLMMITAIGSLALPDDVMGQPCTLCSGSQNIQIGLGGATGFGSYAFGLATSAGDYGFSIGSKVFAQGKKSFVIGYKAEAASTDTLNFIFGSGTEDDDHSE